jgi:hypothetical protein
MPAQGALPVDVPTAMSHDHKTERRATTMVQTEQARLLEHLHLYPNDHWFVSTV